ncbi:hypothetical protein [Chryseobacterium indoltheticum]|uniref:hypothetical protein n=1 Tax=Chryseobacterium indoltheticum TaxID=254 RepID=UPI003F497893
MHYQNMIHPSTIFKKASAIFKDYEAPALKAFVMSNLGKLFIVKKNILSLKIICWRQKIFWSKIRLKIRPPIIALTIISQPFTLNGKAHQKALSYALKTGDFTQKNSVDF